jgi:hypothetical protein
MALDPAILAGPALLWAKSVVFAQSSATCGGGAQSLCLGKGEEGGGDYLVLTDAR